MATAPCWCGCVVCVDDYFAGDYLECPECTEQILLEVCAECGKLTTWNNCNNRTDFRCSDCILKNGERRAPDCCWENGTCIGQRGLPGIREDWYSDDHACCCNCAKSYGYYASTKDAVPDGIMELFRPGEGFRGPEGCRIPREKRSKTCQTFQCEHSIRAAYLVELAM